MKRQLKLSKTRVLQLQVRNEHLILAKKPISARKKIDNSNHIPLSSLQSVISSQKQHETICIIHEVPKKDGLSSRLLKWTQRRSEPFAFKQENRELALRVQVHGLEHSLSRLWFYLPGAWAPGAWVCTWISSGLEAFSDALPWTTHPYKSPALSPPPGEGSRPWCLHWHPGLPSPPLHSEAPVQLSAQSTYSFPSSSVLGTWTQESMTFLHLEKLKSARGPWLCGLKDALPYFLYVGSKERYKWTELQTRDKLPDRKQTPSYQNGKGEDKLRTGD